MVVCVSWPVDAGQSDYWFTGELDAYRALVEAYRVGGEAEAIEGVLAFAPDVIHGLIDRVRPPDARVTGTDAEPALNEQLFRAAAMLHTDVADRLWSRGRERAANEQLEVAVRWIDLSIRSPEPMDTFRRRWYLGVTLLAFERGGWQAGVAFVEVATARVPDDVAVRTTAAWMHEELALTSYSFANGGESGLRRRQDAKRDLLQVAAGHATVALAHAPDAVEAALRLARVQILLEQFDAAEVRLSGLVARADLLPGEAYLARLLLGTLYAGHDRPGEAERLFREAVDLVEGGQAARMALSRLFETLGDRRGAAEALQSVMAAEVSGPLDPWVAYRLGTHEGPAVRERLRREVRE